MKVVLLQDVKGTGKKDDIVNVSDGYARNFLLPRKLAKEASAGAISEIATKQKAKEHHKAEEKKAAQELAAKLEGQTVTIHAKAGESGRLFGSVTPKEVAEALKQVTGEEIPKNKITIDGDIKTYGEYRAKIKVYPEVTATIGLKVTE